jgi:hypothetical protein
MTPFESALVAHLVADWLLQNEWMAVNKTNLRHPAGWVHASIHAGLLSFGLGWLGGAVLGFLHLLIDTGKPVDWWIRKYKKCESAPHATLIRIWTDQTVHIALIAAWVLLFLRN